MTSEEATVFASRAFDAFIEVFSLLMGAAFLFWLFDISDTSTKLWVLASLIAVRVLAWIAKRMLLGPRLLSLVKGRNVVQLMTSGFGRKHQE